MTTNKAEQKQFAVNINLDDETEVAEFIDTYGTTKGRSLANQLDLHGVGADKAATALSNYAWNKHTAIACRKQGSIEAALKYEAICDQIYSQDIQPMISCW